MTTTDVLQCRECQGPIYEVEPDGVEPLREVVCLSCGRRAPWPERARFARPWRPADPKLLPPP